MPVSPDLAESNRLQTERLRRLVSRLDAARLAVRLSNGWTVAGALVHVAFWDRQRLCLMRRWASGDICSGAYDGDVFNAAMQPLLEMIPPERVAAAAVKAAEEIDALLLELSDEVIEAALARPDAPNLDRGSHRRHHLDLVERALAEAGPICLFGVNRPAAGAIRLAAPMPGFDGSRGGDRGWKRLEWFRFSSPGGGRSCARLSFSF